MLLSITTLLSCTALALASSAVIPPAPGCTTLIPVYPTPTSNFNIVYTSTLTTTSTFDCNGCSLVSRTFTYPVQATIVCVSSLPLSFSLVLSSLALKTPSQISRTIVSGGESTDSLSAFPMSLTSSGPEIQRHSHFHGLNFHSIPLQCQPVSILQHYSLLECPTRAFPQRRPIPPRRRITRTALIPPDPSTDRATYRCGWVPSGHLRRAQSAISR